MNELQHIVWDIVLFSETRTATGTYTSENGARLFTAKGGQIADGVAVLIHTSLIPYVIRVKRFDGRLIYIDLRMQSRTIRVISIYCPHAGYPLADLVDLYRIY